MKRESLHAWLQQNCPAYRSLPAGQQTDLLDEAIAEERAHVRSERKDMLVTIGVVAVLVLALLPFTGDYPLGSILLGLAFMVFGGVSRYRIGSRIELRVRTAALARADRLMADRLQGR